MVTQKRLNSQSQLRLGVRKVRKRRKTTRRNDEENFDLDKGLQSEKKKLRPLEKYHKVVRSVHRQ